MNVDADDWVLHACGSGTGSGGPWEIVLACMQLDESNDDEGAICRRQRNWVWWPMGNSLGLHMA